MGQISDESWRGIRPSGRSIHDEPHDNKHERSALMNDLCQLGLLPKGLANSRHIEPHDHLLRHFASDLVRGENSAREYTAERRARRALAENRRKTTNTRQYSTADSRRPIDELVHIGKTTARQRSVEQTERHLICQWTRTQVSRQTIKQNRALAKAIAQGFFVDGLAFALAESLQTGSAEKYAGVEDFFSALKQLCPRKAEDLQGAVYEALTTRHSGQIAERYRKLLCPGRDY